MRSWLFFCIALSIGAIVFAVALALRSDYLFFAGYVVLQFVVLATAWNILGGYCGYVNFGSAAFFAIGVYTSVALAKLGANPGRYLPEFLAASLKPLLPLPILALQIFAGLLAGIVGQGCTLEQLGVEGST